jgi:hypothetical protein
MLYLARRSAPASLSRGACVSPPAQIAPPPPPASPAAFGRLHQAAGRRHGGADRAVRVLGDRLRIGGAHRPPAAAEQAGRSTARPLPLLPDFSALGARPHARAAPCFRQAVSATGTVLDIPVSASVTLGKSAVTVPRYNLTAPVRALLQCFTGQGGGAATAARRCGAVLRRFPHGLAPSPSRRAPQNVKLQNPVAKLWPAAPSLVTDILERVTFPQLTADLSKPGAAPLPASEEPARRCMAWPPPRATQGHGSTFFFFLPSPPCPSFPCLGRRRGFPVDHRGNHQVRRWPGQVQRQTEAAHAVRRGRHHRPRDAAGRFGPARGERHRRGGHHAHRRRRAIRSGGRWRPG